MECLKCGEHIYIESPFGDKLIDAGYPGEIGNKKRDRDMLLLSKEYRLKKRRVDRRFPCLQFPALCI